MKKVFYHTLFIRKENKRIGGKRFGIPLKVYFTPKMKWKLTIFITKIPLKQ